MANLLHIDSSSRGERSHAEKRSPENWEALRISDELVDEFLAAI